MWVESGAGTGAQVLSRLCEGHRESLKIEQVRDPRAGWQTRPHRCSFAASLPTPIGRRWQSYAEAEFGLPAEGSAQAGATGGFAA